MPPSWIQRALAFGKAFAPAAVAGTLLLAALMLAVLQVYISSTRALTPLEGSLLQLLTLASSIAGSVMGTRLSASAAARDVLTPSARSAFRRLVSIYGGLDRIAQALRTGSDSRASEVRSELSRALAIAGELLCTLDDALEDWHDLVPDQVRELRARLRQARELHTTTSEQIGVADQ